MYALFIRQLAKLIESGGGRQNKVCEDALTCVVKIFEDCGLGTKEEAYMCVVPDLVVVGVLLDEQHEE